MPLSETANLVVDMNLRGNFRQGMRGASGDLKNFSTQANRTESRLGRLRGQLNKPELKSGLLQGVGLSGGLIGFQLLGTAVSKTIDIVGDSIRMAAEEEAAIQQLSRAIDANVESWDGNIEAVERQITANQRLAYSDGEQRDALRLLIGQTNDVEEAFRLLGTSMDFARFRGIDLKTSADLLGRAYAGNFGTLSRYGVVLKEGATATEALAQIQRMAAGQARSYAESDLGKLERANIAVSDAMEDLGRTLLPVVGELAGLAADTIPTLVAQTQDALAPLSEMVSIFGELQTAADGVSDIVGRDLVNDFANFARIVGTGGTALAYDSLPALSDAINDVAGEGTDLGNVYDDWFGKNTLIGGSLGDLGDTVFGTGQEFKSYTGELERATNALATFPRVADDAADSSEAATREVIDFADAARALNRAFGGATSVLGDFRDAADDIAETRSLGQINKDLQEQIRIRRRAIEQGRVADFAAAEAAIARLEEEKKLRRLGKRALREARQNARGATAAQQLVTDSVADTTKEAKRLLQQTRKKYGIKVSVDDRQLAAAIAKAQALGSALNLIGSTVIGAVTGIGAPHKAAGGPVQAGRAYVVGEHRPEVFVPSQNGRIVPNVPTGGGGVDVYVTPYLTVAAAQVEGNTTKVVRTHRFREKN